MLRSSQCLAADDVTIRCRVRHSEKAADREFTEPQEMICTMRVWHKTNTPSASAVTRKIGMTKARSFERSPPRQPQRDNHGPELLLTSNESPLMLHACCSGEFSDPITMSERFTSFGSGSVDKKGRRSNSRQRARIDTPVSTPKPLGDVTLGVSDIMVVDMFGRGSSHQCNITTLSNGYFEFTMENRNGQDILLAFLKATLPKDRVMGMNQRTGSELSNRTGQSERSAKSFDVEAFTATRMQDRLQSETISEKLRRKVVRVFSSFEEMSVALTECACGCSKDSISPAPQSEAERRDSPPPGLQYEFGNLEPAVYPTPEQTIRLEVGGGRSPESTTKRRQMLKECNLPSGLSVETEDGPELETAVFFQAGNGTRVP